MPFNKIPPVEPILVDSIANPGEGHYRGDGVFMVSGRNVSYRRRFKPENL